jgi:hypothetical protein
LRRRKVVFAIRVFKQGKPVSDKPLKAEGKDANEAIDEIEARLGLKPPRVSIDKDGKMSVVGWHGYEFVARAL